MESVKATSLNSEVGTFLHMIPSTISIHLGTTMLHILVHRIPNSKSLAKVPTKLTIFNTWLSLTEQPRWLTTDNTMGGKSASKVVNNITGPRAVEYVGQHLAACSTAYRTEHQLEFYSHTNCVNSHRYGHHNNKFTNPATCWWCASLQPTGGLTCPTATCHIRSRPSNHAVLTCVNCKGPHNAHTMICPSHPHKLEERESDRDEEEMTS